MPWHEHCIVCEGCKREIKYEDEPQDSWELSKDGKPYHKRCIPKLNQVKGEIGEFLVAERLQAAGFEVFRGLDIPGVDLLARRGNTEATIQVKFARKVSRHTWQVGGKHGSARNIRRADWFIAVLPDHRMFILPKRTLVGSRVRFDDRKVQTFNPFSFRLFTDVEVHTSLDESRLSYQLSPAKPNHANTAAYYPGFNRVELYLREILRIRRNLFRSWDEDIFVFAITESIVHNAAHEIFHAALQDNPRWDRDERAINMMAARLRDFDDDKLWVGAV